MPTESEHSAIKARAAARLLALPGVVAVGLGSKEVGDAPTDQLAIKVFVKVKRPPEAVPADELIPAEIEGVPTDVIESGEIHLVADPPGAIKTAHTEDTRFRPLTGGGRIRREGSSWSGTMGCFLVDPGDMSKVYGLTNFHVVAAGDVAAPVAGTSRLGQPSGSGSVTACCSDVFGTFAGGAKSGDRDEALVRLDPGTQWLAEIAEIGMVEGTYELKQEDAKLQTYRVRKRGARTQLTGGVVRALEATTGEADNLVVIKPNPNPAAGAQTVYFDYEGDSGSAVVNKSNEAVALVYARDDSGNGYAYAIKHVLARFASVEKVAVEVAVAVAEDHVNTVPGAAMVATPPELADALGRAGRPAPALRPVPPSPPPGWVPEPVLLSAGPPHLERDLDRSSAGRALMTIWLDHQVELLTLVNSNRRVAVAWHRSGASALFQALARMPLAPEVALPTTINGEPLAACLDRMQATFDRFASARLRRDLARVQGLLPDLAGLTYPQIIDALGTG
jgi:hypothetical protein